jgi:hypothetical protein
MGIYRYLDDIETTLGQVPPAHLGIGIKLVIETRLEKC